MEILIQTKKHMYHITRKGIRKAAIMDWKRFMETFEVIFDFQSKKLKEQYEASTLRSIDKHVEKGYVSAQQNHQKWLHIQREKAKKQAELENLTAKIEPEKAVQIEHTEGWGYRRGEDR